MPSVWSSMMSFVVSLGVRLVIIVGLMVVGFLGIMGVGLLNPRLGLWVATIGFYKSLAIVLCVGLGIALVVMVFRVEPSDRLSYSIIAAAWGAFIAFALRRVLLRAREEISEAETGTGPGQSGS